MTTYSVRFDTEKAGIPIGVCSYQMDAPSEMFAVAYAALKSNIKPEHLVRIEVNCGLQRVEYLNEEKS